MIKINKYNLPEQRFTVLVSGGVDSIVGAHWLKNRYRKNFNLLHFNHKVQEANDLMEEKVTQFSKDFSFDDFCVITRRDAYCSDLSENGLRQWRINKLNEEGGNFVTAHHLNDAVENYIDNCLKGCPEYKPISEVTKFDNFTIYHPFIKTRKQDIIKYALDNNLMKYVVEDPTNKEVSFKRNWIRNKLAKEIYDRDIGIEKVVLKKFYLT